MKGAKGKGGKKKKYFVLISQAKPNLKYFPLLLFNPDPPSGTDMMVSLHPPEIYLEKLTVELADQSEMGLRHLQFPPWSGCC